MCVGISGSLQRLPRARLIAPLAGGTCSRSQRAARTAGRRAGRERDVKHRDAPGRKPFEQLAYQGQVPRRVEQPLQHVDAADQVETYAGTRNSSAAV